MSTHLTPAPLRLPAGTHAAATWRYWAPAIAGAVALALSARAQVPFLPLHIPFSLQTPTVLLIAAGLGRQRAVAAVLSVLCLGAAGAPVLAGLPGPAAFVGVRAGYLWGFLAAAAYLGHGRRREHLVHWWVGAGLVLLLGWARLALLLGPGPAWAAGVAPFWLADAAKAIAAMGLWRLALGRRRHG